MMNVPYLGERPPLKAVASSAGCAVGAVEPVEEDDRERRDLLREVLDERVDEAVRELLDVTTLVVAEEAPGVGLVEHLLELDVRHRRGEVDERRYGGSGPVEHRSVLLRRAEADDHHGVAGLELVLLGDERRRRRVQAADHDVDVRRQRGDHVPRVAQGGSSLVQAPEQEAEVHHRAGLVQLELELRHDREVAAAAAQRPEQVGVLLLGRHQHVTGGCHDAGGEQVVDRQPVLAAQPPHAAAEREPTDAGVADQPDRHRQPVRLGGGVQVAEQRPAADLGPPRNGIDDHLVHRRRGRSPGRRPRRTSPPCCAPRRARPPRGRWQQRTGRPSARPTRRHIARRRADGGRWPRSRRGDSRRTSRRRRR